MAAVTPPPTSRSRLLLVGIAIVVIVAATLIILPSLSGGTGGAGRHTLGTAAGSPAQLVMSAADLPRGTRVIAHRYITTVQASRRDRNTLAFLRQTGRETGFERDFRIPGHGEIDQLVVPFRTSAGLTRAFAYYLTLASGQGLQAIPFRGLGDQAAVVVAPGAAFTEFRRGRFYAVVTTLPAGPAELQYLRILSRRLDQRIQNSAGTST